MTAWQRIPVSLKLGLPAVLAVGAWVGYQSWLQSHAVVAFVAPNGGVVPALDLTFYPEEFSFAAPSPPLALGVVHVSGTDEAIVGADLVPQTALMRYAGQGVGTGFARVALGRPNAPIHLTEVGRLAGRVGVQDGFFSFGLRSTGPRPVADARILGLGGGDHGVLLCETTSDAEGHFELSGFATGTTVLAVRVLAAGYAIASVSCPLPVAEEVAVPLVPTRVIEGAVALPPGVDPGTLRILAKGLPGVECGLAADGTFALDHVPPEVEPRLLVHGLGPEWTHTQVRAAAGDRSVRLVVTRSAEVRGRIVDRQTQQPIAGAMVWHENGPTGMVAVDADTSGWFVLGRMPPGEVVLRAQVSSEDPFGHKETRVGERRIVVEAGKDLDGVIVGID